MHALILLISCISLGHSAKLPSGFKRCEKHSKNVQSCLEDAITKVLPILKKGVPSIGMPPLEPIKITELAIASSSGPVSLDLTLKNINVYDVFDDTTVVKNAEFELDKYRGSAWIDIKRIRVESQYEMNGRVLLLPLKGSGDSNITFTDAKVLMDIQLEPFKKADGKTYTRVKSMKADLQAKKKRVAFENLVSTDKGLSDNMNVFLNENLEPIYAELGPAINEALASAFTAFANIIFNKVPYDDIFPEKM